jgi:hypothetical protein
MAKSIMGGHNLGSIKSGQSGGRTASLPTPSNAAKPAAAPRSAIAAPTAAVGGPGGSGAGPKGAMPAAPPMQITPSAR